MKEKLQNFALRNHFTFKEGMFYYLVSNYYIVTEGQLEKVKKMTKKFKLKWYITLEETPQGTKPSIAIYPDNPKD